MRRHVAYRRRHYGAAALVSMTCLLTFLVVRWKSERDEVATTLPLLAELADTPDFAALPQTRLVSGYERLLRVKSLATSAADRKVLTRLEERFQRFRRDSERDGFAKLNPPRNASEDDSQAERDILEGVLQLSRLATVFGDSTILRGVDDALKPRLAVRLKSKAGEDIEGEVGYRILDPITGVAGPIVPLGPLPLPETRVPAAYLRVVVRSSTGTLHEFPRYLRRRAELHAIDAVVDPVAGVGTHYVRFAGGTLRLADPERDGRMSGINHRVIPVEPFEIGKYEVSNGEYRAFLAAHPSRRPPIYWDHIQIGSVEDSFPVTFISWDDAAAYAAWIGARLPTHAEWVFAARGEEGRRFAWPNAEPGVYLGNTHHEAVLRRLKEDRVPHYLARAAPVHSHEEAATREGVFHLLGNALEFTESLSPDRNDVGDFVARFHDRVVLGASWSAEANGEDLTALTRRGTGQTHTDHRVGFRCARSIQ